MSKYGTCPKCGADGVSRERRPNGDDRCANGCVYPSIDALPPRQLDENAIVPDKPQNPYAFPMSRSEREVEMGMYSEEGMGLRDYFAGQVMSSMTRFDISYVGGLKADPEGEVIQLVKGAYKLADAMLAERSKHE